MTRIALNGTGLNVVRRGAGPGEPLLLLHGFTGSAATWAPLQERLAARWRTIALDLIGHGQSDAPDDPARFTLEWATADLRALLDVLDVERAALLGYSLGGRLALHFALAAPERVSRLLLESAAPGIADPAERAARVAADEALASDIEREGLEAFVARWEALPLWASQARLPDEVRGRLRCQRLRSDPRGLANSLRGMGAGAMEPVTSRLGELTLPVQLVVGELDTKYVALGRELAGAIPGAALAVVPGAGHAVHLERPEVFAQLVERFLTVVPLDGMVSA